MLQQTLKEELGSKNIQKKEVPDYIYSNLTRVPRPYIMECMRYFLSYMEDYDDRLQTPHLLFHMATGSGKTLVMAASILYLYDQGYRNFLFFVDTNNIVEKTKDNFLHTSSPKCLFVPQININGRQVEVRQVENFQGASTDGINLCLTTIQSLHSALNSNKENALTYDDFSDAPVVLISDEAHHMNGATKKGKKFQGQSLYDDTAYIEYDDENTRDWESTVMRIFTRQNGVLPNIMLEFTATADLTDSNIKKKYEDKIIYDYPLMNFREDRYSKEVKVFEADLNPIDRALQAIVLSQYKRKLFGSIKQDIKSVILFKSKTIADNKAFFDDFKHAILTLDADSLDKIKARSKDVLIEAFSFFEKEGVTLDNLALELQEDFSEERLLLIDGNNISTEKQQLLNSLENKTNQVRAIFAVDMLNEGWDVLNLYDIVRLYDTRDAKDNKPGKTTVQEAQLIGRGARYMPFVDPSNPSLDKGKRKYDDDVKNPLRTIETLHYHCAHNPRYIQELHNALVDTGIVAPEYIEQDLFMKDDFLNTDFYDKALVFTNERLPEVECDTETTLWEKVKDIVFKVNMPTGKMKTGQIFGDDIEPSLMTTETVDARMHELGKHVVRSAMNCFPTFYFDNLKTLYPLLISATEFITSGDYIKSLRIKVIGKENQIERYSQKDKLYIAKEVLKQLEPTLLTRKQSYRGSKLFIPSSMKNTFRKQMTLKFSMPGTGEELGRSMKDSIRRDLRDDLMTKEWYAYNDCYGTSEEKALVKYIDSTKEKLREKYDEFYLLRNEKDVRIYSFKSGDAFEPDFLLFMKRKGQVKEYDYLQIFIEPKGEHLRKNDKWKEDFLMEIRELAEVTWVTRTSAFNVWGVPFFTENQNDSFMEYFERDILDDTIPTNVTECHEEVVSEKPSFRIEGEVPNSDKYTRFLPLYPLRAACGYFDGCGTLPDDEAEGWVDVSRAISHLHEGMFIVHAEGSSMEPKIHDGDLCVFDSVGVGSHNGEIVLCKAKDKSDSRTSSFTIKNFSSEKILTEEGWRHTKITLAPLNPDYCPIVLTSEEAEEGDFKIYGVFKTIL